MLKLWIPSLLGRNASQYIHTRTSPIGSPGRSTSSRRQVTQNARFSTSGVCSNGAQQEKIHSTVKPTNLKEPYLTLPSFERHYNHKRQLTSLLMLRRVRIYPSPQSGTFQPRPPWRCRLPTWYSTLLVVLIARLLV